MVRRNIELEIRLIDDLLDVTRITRGKLLLQPVRTDLRQVVDHAVAACLSEAREKGLDLVVEAGPEPLPVLGDAARLQQVYWNLVKNAVKFTPAGQVRIRCGRDNDRLVVVVDDDGVGMDAEVVHGIFNAFDQGGVGTTRTFGGLGLGLAISKAIVEMHHGTIVATSLGRGHGSTFTVHLPMDGTAANVSKVPPPSAGVVKVRPPARVLLVEDHEDTARALVRLLQKQGHDVTHARDLASAGHSLETDVWELLISDIGLPDGSGLELMRRLRAKHPAARGIALSGYGMDRDVQLSLEAGFSAHLVKPVDPEGLNRAIAVVLGETIGS
jgi:two-component system, chemotaxis family, CheB/CheR fusion protein